MKETHIEYLERKRKREKVIDKAIEILKSGSPVIYASKWYSNLQEFEDKDYGRYGELEEVEPNTTYVTLMIPEDLNAYSDYRYHTVKLEDVQEFLKDKFTFIYKKEIA